ncbi:hypothetical protein L249_2973, partial [Ophiocordyceps polyrhachis-furcata BCC 54312]
MVALPPVVLVVFKLARRFRSTPTTHSRPAIRSIPSEFLNFHLWLLSQLVDPDVRTADSEVALSNYASSAPGRHPYEAVSAHDLQPINNLRPYSCHFTLQLHRRLTT